MRTDDVLRYFRLLPADVQRRIANDELLPCVTAEMAKRMVRPNAAPLQVKPKPRPAPKPRRGRPKGSRTVRLTAEDLDTIGVKVLSEMPARGLPAREFAKLVRSIDGRFTHKRYDRLVKHLRKSGLLQMRGHRNTAVYHLAEDAL